MCHKIQAQKKDEKRETKNAVESKTRKYRHSNTRYQPRTPLKDEQNAAEDTTKAQASKSIDNNNDHNKTLTMLINIRRIPQFADLLHIRCCLQQHIQLLV